MNIENKHIRGFTERQIEAVRAILAQLNGLSVAEAERVIFASKDVLLDQVKVNIELTMA
ncbi:MAG: hypothetical protein ABUL44_02325 [Flavobacterium sp.]